jgi:hypothetical protein
MRTEPTLWAVRSPGRLGAARVQCLPILLSTSSRRGGSAAHEPLHLTRHRPHQAHVLTEAGDELHAVLLQVRIEAWLQQP